MVTLDHSIYKEITTEIVRWNQLFKTDLVPDILTPRLLGAV
jgi:hypothetical protein